MTRFRLTLEYRGGAFSGWQRQAEGSRTVQGVVEDAVLAVTGQRICVHGSGRTDAGVHAEGQVASIELATGLSPEKLQKAFNANLPHDVAISDLVVAPEDFHARFSARSKRYRYQIWNDPHRSPLREATHWHLRGPLDLAAMAEAGKGLVGTHDFASFQAAGSDVTDTIREMTCVEVEQGPPGEIAIWVEGTGFLRHMVRNFAGFLVEVGQGRRTPDSTAGLLAARDRGKSAPTAPAQGLTLVRVDY